MEQDREILSKSIPTDPFDGIDPTRLGGDKSHRMDPSLEHFLHSF